jgi:HD-GYP domain-containing protein (c-di-GMP phosphodiesterase class II)
VVSENLPPRRPILTLDDLARPLTRRPERLHALTAADLSIALSVALDLAEGKPAGHARRVCYIATTLADALEVDPATRAGVYFGALLHDLGVTASASEICRIAGVDEDAIFAPVPVRPIDPQRPEYGFADRGAVLEAVYQHCALGADLVRGLELPEEAAIAVERHHEDWDGAGYPDGIRGDEIPLQARIVSAADVAEVLIADEPSSLSARRQFAPSLTEFVGRQLDPTIASRLLDVAKSDEFWLGLYADDLTETLTAMRGVVDTRRSRKRVMRFAETFADLADTKGAHPVGHCRRTADWAEKLALAIGLDPGHAEMIRVAALLQDIGVLGVPARVMTKPDILSVTEMQLMRQHPANSEMILEELNGFEEMALWIARHHERPDGKGYPEMLSGDDLPMESRILAVADSFAALTSERPHRGAMPLDEARTILLGAAGTQLDAELVRLFCTLI